MNAQDPRLYRGQNQNSGLTPAQGRVVFHQERLFRSTGSGTKAHARYIAHCAGLLPAAISTWTREQCKLGLILIERSCREERMGLFRDVRTQWETL